PPQFPALILLPPSFIERPDRLRLRLRQLLFPPLRCPCHRNLRACQKPRHIARFPPNFLSRKLEKWRTLIVTTLPLRTLRRPNMILLEIHYRPHNALGLFLPLPRLSFHRSPLLRSLQPR